MGKGGFIIFSCKSALYTGAGSGYHMEFSNGSTYKVTQMFFSLYFFLPVCPVETALEKTSNPGAGKKFKYPASAPGVTCQLWLLAIARTVAPLMVLGCYLVLTAAHESPIAGLMAGAVPLVIAILLWSWSPKAS